MKALFTLGVLIFSLGVVLSQKNLKIPKKIRGAYSGFQPAYLANNVNVSMAFPSVEMKLILDKSSITLCYTLTDACLLSGQAITSIEKIKRNKAKVWIIEPKGPGATVPEHLEILFNEKKIVRQGLGAQPDTELLRIGKKQ